MSRPTGRVLVRRLAWCLPAIAALVALDLVSKDLIFGWLQENRHTLPRADVGLPRHPLLGDWLGLMPNLNTGAAFGRLSDFPYLLVFGRIGAVLLLLWLIARAPLGQGWYLAALVLIVSGAIGNLHDNLLLVPQGDHPFGAVRDFIDVYFTAWDWHFPTFNVADSCITVGAILLLLSGFGGGSERREPAPAEERAAAEAAGRAAE